MSETFRRTRAIINSDALRANCQHLQAFAQQSCVLATVKADGYGHGAIAVAKALQNCVDALGVAFIDEALELRQANVTQPVVLLDGFFHRRELELCAAQNFIPVVHNSQQVDAVLSAVLAKPIDVWLKVDTGMHRLGFTDSAVVSAYLTLKASENVRDIVLMTHFANADNCESDATLKQFDTFNDVVNSLRKRGCDPQVSVANSAGALYWPQMQQDWLRSGILIYGVAPHPHKPPPYVLKPAMRLIAPVIALREIPTGATIGYGSRWQASRPSRIATLALGYGDGYPRHAQDGTPVWINGEIVPMVGRVSMDMITIDVTELKDINVGDEAELWGPNLDIHLVAEHCDTIAYELLTRVSPRVPREVLPLSVKAT